jgi:hypothetical protein
MGWGWPETITHMHKLVNYIDPCFSGNEDELLNKNRL